MPLDQIVSRIISGDAETVARLTREALESGVSPKALLEEGLIAGMTVVGVKFKNSEMFFPEVLVAARAMKAGMAVLEPLLKECGIEPVGKCVLGTVKGDIHDIGKNLVAIMLKGSGFEVVDLGVNVSFEKFKAAIQEHRPEILGMSALLTTTMIQMRVNMEGFQKAHRLPGNLQTTWVPMPMHRMPPRLRRGPWRYFVV
jgi:5-methyltetrahydrofolate--homocysteine methyltransferase